MSFIIASNFSSTGMYVNLKGNIIPFSIYCSVKVVNSSKNSDGAIKLFFNSSDFKNSRNFSNEPNIDLAISSTPVLKSSVLSL
ncbi:hypothetical protein [Tenacibaculum maritimum]|uniref:hypothetical protein n=1 Tax=Tenacibaculum maritimum TaxID=107401 RepID=UPI0038906E08